MEKTSAGATPGGFSFFKYIFIETERHMKLERLFSADGKKLCRIQTGEEFSPQEREVKWSDVEGAPEEYNEEFLASLRNELKEKEENGEFAVIVPVVDKEGCAGDALVAAMKHTARRIKDCVSVVGFAVPAGIDEANFIGELSPKHKHYCFRTKSGWVQADSE